MVSIKSVDTAKSNKNLIYRGSKRCGQHLLHGFIGMF